MTPISASTLPFTMLWAQPSRNVASEVEGSYNYETQKWSSCNINSITTWCRSSTTGVITSDPDEDKDD